MPTALKDIDRSCTSFVLDLLLEVLIKEGKQLWLFVQVALLLNFIHICSYP